MYEFFYFGFFFLKSSYYSYLFNEPTDGRLKIFALFAYNGLRIKEVPTCRDLRKSLISLLSAVMCPEQSEGKEAKGFRRVRKPAVNSVVAKVSSYFLSSNITP